MYRVRLAKRAERNLGRIRQGDPRAYDRIKAAIIALGADPRPPGVTKLRGVQPPAWRLRVGEYRIVYEILDGELVVLVVNVAVRGEIYK